LNVHVAESNEKLRSRARASSDADNEVRIRSEELETLRTSLEAEGFVATADGDVMRAPEPEIAETSR